MWTRRRSWNFIPDKFFNINHLPSPSQKRWKIQKNAKSKPSQKTKYSKLGENLGKIEIEGCYPGYGTTLGNTLAKNSFVFSSRRGGNFRSK